MHTPGILKTDAFPIGNPDIYIGQDYTELIEAARNYNFSSVEGLVRCKVLPPRDLFHPVLPYRVRGKLLFALCRSCCETFFKLCALTTISPIVNSKVCEYPANCPKLSRKVISWQVWVKSGNIKSHNTIPVGDTRQGGLFVEYINTFLQLKQEASGWPSECENDDAKERYLRETEGIVLDKNNISRNLGLRSVAELCLNSFWGKFG